MLSKSGNFYILICRRITQEENLLRITELCTAQNGKENGNQQRTRKTYSVFTKISALIRTQAGTTDIEMPRLFFPLALLWHAFYHGIDNVFDSRRAGAGLMGRRDGGRPDSLHLSGSGGDSVDAYLVPDQGDKRLPLLFTFENANGYYNPYWPFGTLQISQH